jgi:hypothetical protein
VSRIRLLAVLSFVLTAWSPALRAASITYNIQSYASLQNGDVLSGTITTDGNITTPLTRTDITSWNYKITNGPNTIVTASGDSSTVFINGAVLASQTQITIASPVTGENSFEFHVPPGGLGVLWSRTPTSDSYFAFDAADDPIWTSSASSPPGLGLPTAPGTWIIGQAAAVPEPGSLALVLIGSACVAGHWARRRRNGAPRPLVASPTVRS